MIDFKHWMEQTVLVGKIADYLATNSDATPANIIGIILGRDISPEGLTIHDKLEADDLVRAKGFMDVRHFITFMTGKDPDAVNARKIQIQQDKLSHLLRK
jgi:hypothetical protein